MPNAEEKVTKNINKIDKRLDNLSDNIDALYQSTYQSRMDDKKDMENIVSSIDDNIDSILLKINNKDITDISSIYLRLQEKENKGNKSVIKSLEDSFNESNQLMDTINIENIRKSIQAENYQYDLICRYMTKLEDALDIKKDNVLSSDNFTKEFINVVTNKASKNYIAQFDDRANVVKTKYKVQTLFEDMYYKASKYGEYFLYHVPYKTAFERLLKRKQSLSNGIVRTESQLDDSSKLAMTSIPIYESSTEGIKDTLTKQNMSQDFIDCLTQGDVSVNLFLDESGIIPRPIEVVKEAIKVKENHVSLTESYLVESSGSVVHIDGTDANTLKMDPDSLTGSEGLIDSNGKSNIIKNNIMGSVLYEIPRENIFPLAMDKTVIGYIYIQVANNYVDNMVMNGYTYNSLTNNTQIMADEYDKQNDIFASYISGLIAEKIDAKFINSNIDIKEQIFAVLRYNDHFCSTNGTNNITVSFIPADDIHHFYFKLNDKTHRGISDLDKAVVPAMIYCLLYLNTVIGHMSRSQDKRVYYVKQNVEQNVAHTLLNVISQLKKGNMGMRQLENMNTIFNVIGKYNDHIIPVSQSGDPPIQMEVLQGQNIETPTDLMDRMEDAAVSSTDVPLEFVQSTNAVDYATRFTMSNSKFLRKIYKRQSICQDHFTEIFRKLYNYEFGENDQTMKIMLPAPAFLAMTNSQQLLENVKNYANSIADITCGGEDDEVKAEFLNICVRNFLGTYIDFSKIDDMIAQAKHELKSKADKSDETGGGDENGGAY